LVNLTTNVIGSPTTTGRGALQHKTCKQTRYVM
jgi:hypothetical protein